MLKGFLLTGAFAIYVSYIRFVKLLMKEFDVLSPFQQSRE